jgi:2-dehydro-3-deoxy-D-arabinonate dehydratase
LKLYRKQNGMWLERDHAYLRLEESFDSLVAREDLQGYLTSLASTATTAADFDGSNFEAPIGHQEVWAAGVTYYRSRTARIEESQEAGGGSFYDRVYSAERPELFFKAMAHKVAAPNGEVRIRRDASWSVPEPELVLLVNPRGEIIGYTIGNDMSSRDIEGTNPLYLPQAKVYDQSCALGPCVLISDGRLPASTRIQMQIHRHGREVLAAAVTLAEMKREPAELVQYLFRDQSFPYGCYLLTGTGIVPPNEFTLRSKDEIRVSIDGIGTLVNHVA